jgi:hypothetical protein
VGCAKGRWGWERMVGSTWVRVSVKKQSLSLSATPPTPKHPTLSLIFTHAVFYPSIIFLWFSIHSVSVVSQKFFAKLYSSIIFLNFRWLNEHFCQLTSVFQHVEEFLHKVSFVQSIEIFEYCAFYKNEKLYTEIYIHVNIL